MNGLANAILTLLLSWLRILVNRLWALLNSEPGVSFYTFLAEHWLVILLVLCVSGFVLDKIIYLIRWRPFTVWLRRRDQRLYDEEDEVASEWPVRQEMPNTYAPPAAQTAAMAPQAQSYNDYEGLQSAAPENPTRIYYNSGEAPAQTAVYSNVAQQRAYRPPMTDVEPVFDEDLSAWEGSDELVVSAAESDPADAPAQVSDQYMLDVQAGFARPVPPQQLYAAPAGQTGDSVHPGLDVDVFRRNIGLGYDAPHEEPPAYEQEEPMAVSFTPFTRKVSAEDGAKKKSNPFLSLMRLVGDDASRPSIHDLHSTVDVRSAFHEPVFPQNMYADEEDPS